MEYYLIGSLRNKKISQISTQLRNAGIKIFDSWYAAGPNADDCWKKYEVEKGFLYTEALRDYAAQHIFNFDKYHLDRCDGAILIYPAGKSAHLELGYVIGQGKPGYIILDEDDGERWDVMLQFATGIYWRVGDLIKEI